MDGSKLKNIIIAVLIVANAVLAAVLGMRSYETKRADAQAIDNSVAAIERLGVSVDRELVAADYPTLYPSEIDRDLDDSEDYGWHADDDPDVTSDAYITAGTPSKSLAAALLVLCDRLEETGTPAGAITGAELGWTSGRAAPGYTRLQPTWLIRTSDAGEWYVDAMTLATTQRLS